MKVKPLLASRRLSGRASLFAPVSFESRLLAATLRALRASLKFSRYNVITLELDNLCAEHAGVPIFLPKVMRFRDLSRVIVLLPAGTVPYSLVIDNIYKVC